MIPTKISTSNGIEAKKNEPADVHITDRPRRGPEQRVVLVVAREGAGDEWTCGYTS